MLKLNNLQPFGLRELKKCTYVLNCSFTALLVSVNPSTCIILKSVLNYARMTESNSPSLIPLELLSTCSGKKLLNGDKGRSLKIG